MGQTMNTLDHILRYQVLTATHCRDQARAAVAAAHQLQQAVVAMIEARRAPDFGERECGTVAMFAQAGAAIATIMRDAQLTGADPRDTWALMKAVGDELVEAVSPAP